MAQRSGPGWRWSNVPVPVPEPHVAGMLAGILVDLHRRTPIFEQPRAARVAGSGLVAIGLAVSGWAVRAHGEQLAVQPMELVATGPYAFSRNPMYLGWTALYVGVALYRNTIGMLVVLPAVVAATHAAVRREERTLEASFGDRFTAYQRDVPRYL